MKKDTNNTITPTKYMYLVPHFHYDVAWIHTEEEEEKRGASLVKQFCGKARSDPPFKFILDQVPLLQAFMRQYPEEVSYLRQLIDSGRCELCGGLYVQPDENLVHGESLIRQAFYGQKWLVETFGRKAKALGGWNIDSFGHTMQLPQVLSKGRIKYVVFARPGAGESTNLDFEHSEFNWSSPDGSVIFTHAMPSYFCVGDKIGRQDQDNDEAIQEVWDKLKPHSITIANRALRITFDSHGNIISLIDKYNDEREIIEAGRYGNQLICQADNGDEYEYCLGQVLGTTEDYPCTIKMYKGPVMTRLIAESKFTESNCISREVKLYSKAGPDIECPDACEKGKHTFEYSLYPHSGSWQKAFTYRRGWELNNPIYYVITDLHSGQLPQEKSYITVSDNVVLAVMRMCNDTDAGVVLRIYNPEDVSGTGTITLNTEGVTKVEETNLLGDIIRPLNTSNHIDFTCNPMEIKTFRAYLKC